MRYKLPALFICSFLAILNFCAAQTTYPSGVSGCIARWNFTNSGTVTSVPDVSNNGNNGVPYNIAPAVAFRTITNKAMKFDGGSSRAMVPDVPMLSPGAMTIIALVKVDDFYSGFCENSQIITKGYPYFVSGNYGLSFSDNLFDGACGTYSPNNMQLCAQFNNFLLSPPVGNYVQKDKWYFCAVSCDGNAVKYYQVEMDTAVYHSTILPFFAQSGGNAPIGANNLDLCIGCTMNSPYPYWFNGIMDELILFNKVLTDAEVQSVYEYLWGRLTVSTNDTFICNSNQLTVNYTTYNPDHYQTGNVFTAQLSDAAGSFASPVNIGSVASTVSGSINCTIPGGVPPGGGYRVRVVASNVPFISKDNGVDISYNILAVNLNIGNDTAICSGIPITLSAPALGVGTTYQWSNGTNGQSITTAATGTYWVTVTSGGCTASDTINITQTTGLNISLGNDVGICPGEATTLAPVNQLTGATYLWNTGSNAGSITTSAAGTYWVSVAASGCTGSDTVVVTEKPIPDVELGNDAGYCAGTSLTLSPSTQPTGASYLWSNNSTQPQITISTPGEYILSVTVAGCVGHDTVIITELPLPDVDLGNDTAICEGATITTSVVPGSGNTYLWNTGSTQPLITVSDPGTYWLTVSDGLCTNTDTVTVSRMYAPTIFLGNDTTLCTGQVLYLPKSASNNTTYTTTWQDNTVRTAYTVSASGIYSATVSNACGSVTDSVNVVFNDCNYWFPSAFTPDGDGLNEKARLMGTLNMIGDFQLMIYNRWGNCVYRSTDKYAGWDGRNKGKMQDVGTYYYYLKFKMNGNEEFMKGDLTLLR